MKRNSLFVFALFTTVALCIPQYVSAQPMGNVFRQEGLASWYGTEFDGRPTASGEIFNSTLFTAAHPSLPFGTFLLITNKQNNRQITVKVNDRGPFIQGRIIDLSKAAAEHLDMVAAGTAPVIIEAMPTSYPPAEPPSPVTMTPMPGYGSGYGAAPGFAPAPGFGPEPAAAPVEQASPYPYPPVTVNIYSTPQPQAQPEFETVQVQPQFDSYSQPWLQSMPPYDYQPEAAAPPAYAPPPPAYAPPPPPPPTYYAPPSPPPAYALPPPAEIAPPPSSGFRLLPATNPLPGRVYRLQVGSYKIPRHAVDAFDKLKAAGLNPSYEPNGEYYRVVLTRVPGTEVPSVVARLEYAGFREALIKEER